METTKLDIAIIGGGIVGLWCAYEILRTKKNITLAVFEQESFLGEHTTGRNSEVLHAGLYYPHDSLKYKFCIEGNRHWREFITKTNLNFLDCGKYIVATKDTEEKLEKLFSTSNLKKVHKKEIDELKKIINVEAAYFSPTSAVLDVSLSVKVLSQLIENLGGIILKNSKVKELEKDNEGFRFNVNQDAIHADALINCAGLFAVDIRKQLGLTNFTNRFVKGSYLKLTKKLRMRNLIYPVPPDHGLGLGVHLTLDNQGEQKFGPNTEDVSEINYKLNQNLINEMHPAIKEIFFSVKAEDLQLGYAGIRPKIHDKDNKLINDFVINSNELKNYYELLGIESPGLTAAPAIAKKIASLLTA